MGRSILFISVLNLILQILLLTPSVSSHRRILLQNGTVSSCPLNFSILRRVGPDSKRPSPDKFECQYIRQGLRLVQSEYLRTHDSFLPPPESAESCWAAYESLVREFVPNFDIRRRCGFRTEWIAAGCMNIVTRSEFEAAVPAAAIGEVAAACNQSLMNSSPCAACTTALSSLQVMGKRKGVWL